MTPKALRLLQDLRRQLVHPPITPELDRIQHGRAGEYADGNERDDQRLAQPDGESADDCAASTSTATSWNAPAKVTDMRAIVTRRSRTIIRRWPPIDDGQLLMLTRPWSGGRSAAP